MKEDEREVLAHIIQNIDEQEIFLEFVAKAETIKEAWQIANIFENKKKDLIQSLQEYDILIKKKTEQLASITLEITQTNELLRDANAELDEIKLQLEEMRTKAQFYKNKILQGQQASYLEHKEPKQCPAYLNDGTDSDPLDFEDMLIDFKPLSTVSVHVKNGATATARVAQVVYSHELYETYQKAGKKLYKLKDRISELELTNKKLSVELRDLSEEDNFKEIMRSKMGADPIDLHDDYQEIVPSIKTQQNIEISLDSLEQAERMALIDKKKEKVEEMLSQLNSVLHEENLQGTTQHNYSFNQKRETE